MLREAVDLLLFAGGDGTARDIYDALSDRLPVLGIPTGCKIHSAVFAANPRSAGELARCLLEGKVRTTRFLEVMDIDEECFRRGELRARLYGYLRVPDEPRLTQGAKAGGGSLSEKGAAESIAAGIVENMRPGRLYLVGSGTTPLAVMQRLDLPGSLLGIDAVRDRTLLAGDVNERALLSLLREAAAAEIIVTPVGGQGYIFGRGNQQLSPEVIRRVGPDNVTLIATPAKLAGLPLNRLRVDTTDPQVDEMLRGWRRVRTSYRDSAVVEVV
jgi:predicted polyphosphate/ATP-dependent NAD kinase